MNKPHKHAEVIKAWADGAEIELMHPDGAWTDSGIPTWSIWNVYRIKPPAPKWPETNLSGDFLDDAWASFDGDGAESAKHIANLALAHALETGQVILPPNKD